MSKVSHSYTLQLNKRDKHVHAKVSTASEDVKIPHSYIEGAARHLVDHACSHLLIENNLDQPFPIWNAVAVAPMLGRNVDGCIKIAVVEKHSEPDGQKVLKIHLRGDDVMTVRIFGSTDEAEAWFLED